MRRSTIFAPIGLAFSLAFCTPTYAEEVEYGVCTPTRDLFGFAALILEGKAFGWHFEVLSDDQVFFENPQGDPFVWNYVEASSVWCMQKIYELPQGREL